MARPELRVPEPTDLLCEKCGYVLNGLPADGQCPECGRPTAQSVNADRRQTRWDLSRDSGHSRTRAYFQTVGGMFRRPTRFFRALATRAPIGPARSFAELTWLASGLMFGVAAATHTLWLRSLGTAVEVTPQLILKHAGLALGFTLAAYFLLDLTTRLTARLSTIEGAQRGYRLPYPIVLRVLYYHSPHWLPVAAVTAIIVVGFRVLWATRVASVDMASTYLYTLCGTVVIAAAHLLRTYRNSVKSVLYANT